MKKLSVLGLMAALLLPVGVVADEHEAPPPLTDVWAMVPKAGMVPQFEAAVTEHMAYRAENDDSRRWMAFTPVIGDKMNIYLFRACCFDWADHDAYGEESEEKGFGKNWNENVNQYVDHYHHYFNKTDWENSHWPDEGTDGPYYGVTTWVIKEDAPSASSEARKQMSQLAKEGGWGEKRGPWVWFHQIGGKDKLTLVAPYSNFADMAPPEQNFYAFAAEQLGSEEKADAMFADFSSGFASSDYTLWKHRKDLSSPSDDE